MRLHSYRSKNASTSNALLNWIRRNKTRVAKILVLLLIIVGGGWAYGYWSALEAERPSYTEHDVVRGDIEATVLSTGTVQPENRLDIKSPIAGRAEKVLVSEGDHIRAGQIIAWVSSIERAALLDAARAEGPEELKYWETLYQPTPIIAPLDGTLIQRNVEPGQTFQTTDPIFVEANRLIVEGLVDETDIAQIKNGMKVEMRLDAYAANPIASKVLHIAFDSRVINSVTTYLVDVLPIKQPEFMRSGMTANLKFFIDKCQGVLMIPTEAIRTLDGGRTVVLVRNDEGRVLQREVKLGLTDGKQTEVLSGLEEGGKVLTLDRKRRKGTRSATSPFGGAPATGE